MAGILDLKPDATDTERDALAVVAGLLPATWTVVLTEPSGSRGASGGSTGDLAIYRGGSVKGVYVGDPEGNILVEEVGAPFYLDAYTPERTSGPKEIAVAVRNKLSSQTPPGVCVDLVNIQASKHETVISTCKKEINPRAQVLIFHTSRRDIHVEGTLPR